MFDTGHRFAICKSQIVDADEMGRLPASELRKRRYTEAFFCHTCSEPHPVTFVHQTHPKFYYRGTFRHKRQCQGSGIGGGGESVEHMTAKYLLQKHVGMYCFHLTQCVDCRCGPLQRTQNAEVAVEFRVNANGHRYACDCMLLRNGQPVIAMEVLHTHETTVQKEEDIRKQNIELVEFTADEILEKFEDIHDKKKEIYLNNLRVSTYLCGRCKENRERRERARQQALRDEEDRRERARQQALKDEQDRLERARQQALRDEQDRLEREKKQALKDEENRRKQDREHARRYKAYCRERARQQALKDEQDRLERERKQALKDEQDRRERVRQEALRDEQKKKMERERLEKQKMIEAARKREEEKVEAERKKKEEQRRIAILREELQKAEEEKQRKLAEIAKERLEYEERQKQHLQSVQDHQRKIRIEQYASILRIKKLYLPCSNVDSKEMELIGAKFDTRNNLWYAPCGSDINQFVTKFELI